MLKTHAVFELREVSLSFWLAPDIFQPGSVRGQDAYRYFETTLSRLRDWQPLVAALERFESFGGSFVVEVSFSHHDPKFWAVFLEEPGRYIAIMRNIATSRLPRKYGDILHVREA